VILSSSNADVMQAFRSIARQQLTFRQCLPRFSRTLSVSPRLLEGKDPSTTGAIFVPAASTTKASFRSSPVKDPEDIDTRPTTSRSLGGTVEKYADLRRQQLRLLSQTGPLSGRTVEVFGDRFGLGMAKLNRILRENQVLAESRTFSERYPPHEVKNMRRSKAHRRRFAQGVARLANIVLRMRRKAY